MTLRDTKGQEGSNRLAVLAAEVRLAPTCRRCKVGGRARNSGWQRPP